MLYRERMNDQSMICDVYYDDLMRDPEGTIASIYDHFQMPFSDAARKSVGDWLKENPQDKHGRHKYTPEQFGLSAEHIRERFAFYIEKYDIYGRN